VLGKGNKVRDVSVPNALLPYIERYQAYRARVHQNFDTNSALVEGRPSFWKNSPNIR